MPTIGYLTAAQIDAGLHSPGASLGPSQFTFSIAGLGSTWPGYPAGSFPFSSSYATLNAAQASAFRTAVQRWDELIAPNFTEVADNATTRGEVRVAFNRLDTMVLGETYLGRVQAPGSPTGDVWLDPAKVGSNYAPGGQGFETMLHELGHALGLKHPHEAPAFSSSFDDELYTVMSYKESRQVMVFDIVGDTFTRSNSFISSLTPSVYDVAAVQAIYGADPTTRTGNDVYTFTQGATTIQTIYDAGGVDTIDLSNFTRSNDIDLRPGNQSSLGIYELSQQNADIFARYPVTNQNEALFRAFLSWQSDQLLQQSRDGIYPFQWTNNLSIAFGTIIENAVGGSGNDTIQGNSADNILRGGAGNDILYGDSGNDRLIGDAGADTLEGGDGADTFVYNAATDSTPTIWDTIRGFQHGVDKIDLSAVRATAVSFQNSLTQAPGANGLPTIFVRATTAAGDIFIVVTGLVDASDILLTAGGAGGTGQGGAGLTGSAAADLLTGTAAADLLLGLAGDDTLNGGAGNDTLDGGAGVDRLIGGSGDDRFLIDDTGDVTVEAAGEGSDTVVVSAANYLLAAGASVERLEAAAGTAPINIAGNESNQLIVGNAGANILSGNGGDDTLDGGAGDDIYRVFTTGTVLLEAGGGGFDTVYASGTSYFLYSTAEIEYLSYAQQSGTEPIYIVGNATSQVIVGNYGNNILNGRGGGNGNPDTLIGLRGDDVYGVFTQGDVVREAEGEGSDTVYANASYQLRSGASVEILSAVDQSASDAASAFTLRGNGYSQTIVGNNAANVLDGRGGQDTLIGLGGADVFAFTAPLDTILFNRIADFTPGTDRIGLASDVFASVTSGGITAAEFVLNPLPQDADDRLLYDRGSGSLFYDPDGTGPQGATLLAILTGGPALSAADFIVLSPVANLAAG